MQNNIIILGGPGGSGRSTLAKQFAEAYSYNRVYGGAMLREIAAEKGYGHLDEEFGKIVLNEKEFARFHEEYASNHPELDLIIDAQLFEASRTERTVIESMPFAPLIKRMGFPYLCIWIEANEDERVRRIVAREHSKGHTTVTEEEMALALKQRTIENQKRYLQLYGVDYLDVERFYDLQFDTTHIEEEQMLVEFVKLIDNNGYSQYLTKP